MAGPQAIKTTTNASASPLALPQPQTFDVLPLLHEHLAAVDAYFNQNSLPDEFANVSDDIGSSYAERASTNPIQPLNPKELPTKALDVKARIRTALRELEKLPDMERSVEEQEDEIEELEGRIRRQREVLRGLAETAKGVEGRVGGGK